MWAITIRQQYAEFVSCFHVVFLPYGCVAYGGEKKTFQQTTRTCVLNISPDRPCTSDGTNDRGGSREDALHVIVLKNTRGKKLNTEKSVLCKEGTGLVNVFRAFGS